MQLTLNGTQIALMAALVARVCRHEAHKLETTTMFDLTRDLVDLSNGIFGEDLFAAEIKDLGRYGKKTRTVIFTFQDGEKIFIECCPQPEFVPSGDIGPDGPQGGGSGFTEPTRLAA